MDEGDEKRTNTNHISLIKGLITSPLYFLKGERMMEELLIDVLRKAPNKDIQALLLQTYIQEYGALSDTNGEIVRQILMKGADNEGNNIQR